MKQNCGMKCQSFRGKLQHNGIQENAEIYLVLTINQKTIVLIALLSF